MRLFPRSVRFWTALLMLVYWGVLDLTPAVAGLAPSQFSGETSVLAVRDADLIAVQRALEHRVVAQKLRDYGVDPQTVQLRLAEFSDQDLHTLASASRGLPSGSDGLGTLITILVIVILVIVIVKLMNKEIVIK